MADISKLDDISKLQTYEDYIANNITEWEAESISRVCRKIGKIGRMSKKEIEKFDADKEAKKEWERIVAALAVTTALNIRTLKKAYISEFEAWEKQNEYLYRYRGKKPLGVKNGALQGIIDKAVKQNGKDILNLTNTKALSVLDMNGNPIRFQDAIYKSFGDAVKTVTEGKADFYTTMRQAVQSLGGGGCRVNYGGGITRRLDTVVRQNMAYGIKQSHKEYNEIVGREIGADGVEIDYHSNSRPSHRYMQGKQYAKGAEGKTVNGVFYPSAEKEGVYSRLYEDYNCRHYETDIILGVSEPRYSAEELKRFDERDKRLYKIGNIEKDGYGWSQSMRAIEADIRKSKDEINALKSFGNSEPRIKELQNRIKTFQAKYDEISDVTGIAKEKRRLTVQKSQNVLTNNTNLDIMKSGAISGARNPYGEKAKEHAEKYYGLVRSMKTDVEKIAKTTGFSEEQIQEVKNFIFYDKHDLGGEEPELFKPDFMMGESWKRLIDGKPEPHDITLIKHEIMERDLIKRGYTQDEAHIITSKKYNYDKEATEFYDKIEKYSD